MTRTQQQAAVLGVLVVVMAGVYLRAFRRAPVASPAVDAPHAPQSVEGEHAAHAADPQIRQRQRDRARELRWTRDPFTGLRADGVVSHLTLSGILWDPAQPVAIVNGAMLRVGESSGGYRVVQIMPDQVLLTDGQQTVTLTLPP